MHTYIATTGRERMVGGFGHCLGWAAARVAANQSRIVKIVKFRPVEDRDRRLGHVVCEVTSDGARPIRGGRTIPARRFWKALRHG